MRTHDEFTQDLDPELKLNPDTELRRKRSRLTLPPRLCYDWMIVSGNCHYARDRAAFHTYRTLSPPRRVRNRFTHEEIEVTGVGSVELRVCRTVKDGGRSAHTIVLTDVLHLPAAVCNGFNPLLFGSSMSCNMEYWEGADRGGQPVWFAVPFAGGSRLVLEGDPRGESELVHGLYYTLSVSITPQERREVMGV